MIFRPAYPSSGSQVARASPGSSDARCSELSIYSGTLKLDGNQERKSLRNQVTGLFTIRKSQGHSLTAVWRTKCWDENGE